MQERIRAHSPLGPSSAERWINCPGSVRLTRHVEEAPSRYAAEGTAAHLVAELAHANDEPPHMQLGRAIEVDGFTFIVDQEMCGTVASFLEHMNDLPVGVDFSESRVAYEKYVTGGFGTLDRARAAGDTCYVRDLKYGKGVQVFAKENAQLKLYALGWLLEYGWLFPEVTKFNLGIVQPRIQHIDEWTITLEDLMTWVKEVVVPGAKATENSKAAIVAGRHCRFCKIRSTCMVRASSVFKEVVGDFENLDAAIEQAETVVADLAHTIGTPYMSPDQVAKALTALPNIKAWCKDLEVHAMRELQQGREVGGWYLAEGRSNRDWGLTEAELLKQAVAQGVTDPKVLFTKPELITPPAAEKVLGRRHPFLKLEGVIVKPPGKPVLAAPTDGRPKMNLDAAKDFEILSEGE